MSKSFTRNVVEERLSATVSAITGVARSIDRLDDDNPDHHLRILQTVADLQLLASIAVDWNCRCYHGDYPGEMPLVEAIRGNLGLTAAPSKQQK